MPGKNTGGERPFSEKYSKNPGIERENTEDDKTYGPEEFRKFLAKSRELMPGAAIPVAALQFELNLRDRQELAALLESSKQLGVVQDYSFGQEQAGSSPTVTLIFDKVIKPSNRGKTHAETLARINLAKQMVQFSGSLGNLEVGRSYSGRELQLALSSKNSDRIPANLLTLLSRLNGHGLAIELDAGGENTFKACRITDLDAIRARLAELQAELKPQLQDGMVERLKAALEAVRETSGKYEFSFQEAIALIRTLFPESNQEPNGANKLLKYLSQRFTAHGISKARRDDTGVRKGFSILIDPPKPKPGEPEGS